MTERFKQQHASTVIGLRKLPDELWLQIASYLDFETLIQLYATERRLYRILSTAQHLWRQIYEKTFPKVPTEISWLETYCARMAQYTGTSQNMEVNWRHAFAARKQTEFNWRHGTGIEYTYRLTEPSGNNSFIRNWIGFRSGDMMWKCGDQFQVYTIPLTDMNPETEIPLIGQDIERIDTDKISDIPPSSIYSRNVQLHPKWQSLAQSIYKLNVCPSTVSSIGDIHILLKSGRWLVCRRIEHHNDWKYLRDWLLIDILDVFKPHSLETLNNFDIEERNANTSNNNYLIRYMANVSSAFRDNVCLLDSQPTGVTIFAVKYWDNTLIWRKITVTYHSTDITTAHECITHSGSVVLNIRGTIIDDLADLPPIWLYTTPLDTNYVYVVVTRKEQVPYYSLILDTSKSGHCRPFHDEHVSRTGTSLLVFEHGWLRMGLGLFNIPLAHRQLVIIVEMGSKEHEVGLRQFSDGSLIRVFKIPLYHSITCVIGDLFLLRPYEDHFGSFILYDMFTGTALRKIPILTEHVVIPESIASATQLLTHIEYDVSYVDYPSNTDDNTEQTAHKTGQTNANVHTLVKLIDFMPRLQVYPIN
jgi:hypothetical protein